MNPDIGSLLAATALFVGGHFALSSAALRPVLVQRLGERGFQGTYAAVALVALLWMIVAYVNSPWIPVWGDQPELRWVPIVIMPFSMILLITGATTRSPTSVVSEDAPGMPPADGILRITRHPIQWGISLWAASHLIAKGDLATIIFMGGFLILSQFGMAHIDRRREATLGAYWGPVAMTTSAVPFKALIQGRTTMDWAGIGLWRPALGLALYVVFLYAHEWVIGVGALPL